LQSKRPEKRAQAEQHLEKTAEVAKDMTIKTLAAFMVRETRIAYICKDVEEKIELLVMEISLKYLTEYRDYIKGGQQTFEVVLPQLEDLKLDWEKRRQKLLERDTAEELRAMDKGKVFGLSIDDLLAAEGRILYVCFVMLLGGVIPTFLEKAFDFLRKIKAEEIEGIFRISGKKMEIDAYIAKVNKSMTFHSLY
jgi:hypothetical protein